MTILFLTMTNIRDIEDHGEKFRKSHLCCGKSCTFALKK